MEEIYLPTFPNVAWLKSALLIDIFFGIGTFLLFFFLWVYFVLKYRRRKKMDKQIDYLQSHALHLQQQMLTQKMQNVAGQALCVLFVEYLERFAINTPYSCVQQLLAQHGFDQDEIDSFVGVLYQGGNLDAGIERKMKLTLHS